MNRRNFLKVITYSAIGAAVPLPFIEAKEVKKLLTKPILLTQSNFAILRIETSEGNLDFKLKVEEASQGKIILSSLKFIAAKTMLIHKVKLYIPDLGFIDVDINFNINFIQPADTVNISPIELTLNT